MTEKMATPAQISNLIALGDKYDGWVQYLESIRPKYVGTPMLAKIDAVLNEGKQKRSTLTDSLLAIRNAWTWIQETGSGAWDAIKSATGLGFLPALAVPWVTVAAATTVLSISGVLYAWIKRASDLESQLKTYDASVQAQIAKGVPADLAVQNAAAAVGSVTGAATAYTTATGADTLGGQVGAQIGTLLKWGAVLGLAYWSAKKAGIIR